jgi:hypothetical protein
MPINPTGYPMPGAFGADIDWTPLAKLGEIIKQQQQEQEASRLISQLYSSQMTRQQPAVSPAAPAAALPPVAPAAAPPSIPLPRARPPGADAIPVPPVQQTPLPPVDGAPMAQQPWYDPAQAKAVAQWPMIQPGTPPLPNGPTPPWPGAAAPPMAAAPQAPPAPEPAPAPAPEPAVAGPSAPPGQAPALASADPMQRYADATSAQESGGDYRAVGRPTKDGDRAFGKYQVMGRNVPEWTEQVLGQRLTPREFLLNPAAQEAVYRAKFGEYVQKYGPEGAARAWFAGERGMNNPNARDVNGKTVAAYAADFSRNANLPPEITAGRSAPQAQQAQAPALDEAKTTAVESLTGDQPQPIGAEQMAALYRNPLTRPLAVGLLQKQLDPGSYDFKVVGNNLVRTNNRTGRSEIMMSDVKDDYAIEKVTLPDGTTAVYRVKKQGAEGRVDLGGQTQQQQADAALTGDEYLAQLDPGRAAQIKALVEGRVAPPSGLALKSPQVQMMMRDAAQYDPGFDFTLWKARNAMYTNATSGKIGQNLSSFNTTIGHMGTLDKAIDGLENTGFKSVNRIANALREQYDPKFDRKLKDFEAAKTAVVDEMTRAFRGTGGNVHDLIQWEKLLNAADSPEALHGVVKQGVELLRSRIEAVGDQYNRGMQKKVPTDPYDLLSPHAKETIDTLGTVTKAAAPAASGAPVRINSDAEYDKLKPNTRFVGPDGKVRTKP